MSSQLKASHSNSSVNAMASSRNQSVHSNTDFAGSGVGSDLSTGKAAATGKTPVLGMGVGAKYSIGTTHQQSLPEKIDFIIANGARGFVYLEETSGTGQRIELPRYDALANMSVNAKSRFLPLTFRATMKDSSQQLYVNGKEELDVASEALSPYWLVIHTKGDYTNLKIFRHRVLRFTKIRSIERALL